MFGAESAVGVEIDPIAIQSAYRNAEMNGIETVFLLPEETRDGASVSGLFSDVVVGTRLFVLLRSMD
jgi:ribosomal protein L11 methylase PrmA